VAIPDYQTIMLPLLRLVGDSQEHIFREVVDTLANGFDLTDEECRELLPGGQQEVFSNRVGWARTYMKKAGLLESPRRGRLKITQRGLEVLAQKPPKIDVSVLDQCKEAQEFRTLKRERTILKEIAETETETTPEEALEYAYQNLKNELANDLLQQIKDSPLSNFEIKRIDSDYFNED
jgi:restriction system protein